MTELDLDAIEERCIGVQSRSLRWRKGAALPMALAIVRTDVPKLIARVRELELEVDRLREIAYSEGLSEPPKSWGAV